MAVPGDGVYATWAHVDSRRHMAATSIGVRPTFNEDRRTVEAFVMDFQDDLYGREVRLEFIRRLRDELRFDSVEALQRQMAADVEESRSALRAGAGRYEGGMSS
jgi:riboflavin kinase/FMN adenylyltransferase